MAVEKARLQTGYTSVPNLKIGTVYRTQAGAPAAISGARASVESVRNGELAPKRITDDANAYELLGADRVGYAFEPYYA